jgi:hypothetical protein
LGYESHASILNLGTLFILLCWWIFRVFVCGLVGLFAYLTGKGKSTYQSLKQKLFWNDLLSVLIEAYIEFIIAGYLNMTAPDSDLEGEIASLYIGYVCLLFTLVIIPIIFFWLRAQPLDRLKEPSFQKKYEALYENCRLESKWTAMFYKVFMWRRIIFVNLAFFMGEWPIF